MDSGEAEALALAHEINATLVLMDERKGRKIAAREQIKTLGIVGVIIKAKQQGILDRAKPVLDTLFTQTNFRANPQLYLEALTIVGEH